MLRPESMIEEAETIEARAVELDRRARGARMLASKLRALARVHQTLADLRKAAENWKPKEQK